MHSFHVPHPTLFSFYFVGAFGVILFDVASLSQISNRTYTPSDTATLPYPPFIPIACDCSCVDVGVGGASGGFIGGVLLTAAITGCVVAAVFYREQVK